MSWIIIFTTILSLATGAGAVYASDDALPGETLYPVKTLVESIRLAVADDGAEPGLRFKFADRRVEELYEIYTTGDMDDVDEAAQGYENQVQLLTQLIEQVQAQDPEEAVKLRQELQTKLQQHARRMEELVEQENEGASDQVRKRVRQALQTNTRLQSQVNEAVDEPEIPDQGIPDSEGEETAAEETSGGGNGAGKGQIGARVHSTDEGAVFEFSLNGQGKNGVYAKIGDTRFDCTLTDETAVCPAGPVREQDRIHLYDAATDELLFSYRYQYKMQTQQKNQYGQNGNGGSGEGSGGGEENRNGKGN